MAVTLYRQVGKGKARRYQKVNLGRGRCPADLTGPHFLRYSLADGTRPWEHVGDDLDEAIAARERKQAYFEALDANVSVNTFRIRLGHESLDVTLAYLKGKDAESEEAQEHANSSSLALYA
jgi:hypothetical protein